MKTALGNDEGPSSQEMWDKLDKIDKQNQLLLDTMAWALAETQLHFRGTPASKLRQIHQQLLSRMAGLTEVPKPQ